MRWRRCPTEVGHLHFCLAAHPHLVFAAVPLAPVEPAVERLDDEPRVLDQRVPLGCGEPVELHRGGMLVAAHREDELPGALVPVGALEDAALALEPETVGLLDVLRARREHVEDEVASGLEQARRGPQRLELLALVRHVEERAKRDRHERNPLLDRRLAEVAEAQVEQVGDTLALRVLPRDGEHPRRLVDADHLDAGAGDGDCDPPGADCQLDHRTARGDGLFDVELDILRDRDRPRVVDPRDPVVESLAHGFRATQTNSGLSRSNGRRSNQP
jgi:hypothetical protein